MTVVGVSSGKTPSSCHEAVSVRALHTDAESKGRRAGRVLGDMRFLRCRLFDRHRSRGVVSHGRAASCLMVLAVATASTACSSAPSSGENVASGTAAVSYGGLNLTWQNTVTGAVGNWDLAGATVEGQQVLGWQCGASNGCSSQWQPVDTQGSSILWYDATTGQLSTWNFDENNGVSADAPYSWTCTAASGCAAAWRPIGRMTLENPCNTLLCGPQEGLLWHDANSGALSIWDLSGSTVTGTQTLNWECSASSGCSQVWRAVLTADMNNDGNTDVLWYDETSGVVSSWLVKGSTVTGTQNLSWQCSVASGCASAWKIVGAADVNADGHTDLTWYNASSGQVSSWLLDGSGHVTGTQAFSWTCSTASGCAPDWRPLGYTSYPPIPPK